MFLTEPQYVQSSCIGFDRSLRPDRIAILGERERWRDAYWMGTDSILKDRLLWRAQSVRQLVHLLPGQTILELGCGRGLFTRKIARVSRGENPITAVTFDQNNTGIFDMPSSVHFINAVQDAGDLASSSFDLVVAMELLDRRISPCLLSIVYSLLKPGGQVIFFESNPWNLFLHMRRLLSRAFGGKDLRHLMSRPRLYELISEVGFIRVFAVFNDFVYPPLTRRLIWFLRNLSIILENTPGIRTMAGSILVHAQKPPRSVPRPTVSLCSHLVLNGKLSVVVPCRNEEMNVKVLVDRLIGTYGGYIKEIILVDDSSTDRTRAVIGEMASCEPRIRPVYRSPPNGVGYALMDGYRAARGDYVLSIDCDFQHLLPELRDLFDAVVEGYDVVVGSRFSRHSVLLNYPLAKIVANRAFHVLAQILFRRHFRDLTNNLKIFRREVLDDLPLTQPGFAINAETGLLPLLMGYRVKEIPISWINRTHEMGVSSFRLIRVGGGYWKVLVHLWRNGKSRKVLANPARSSSP